MAGLSELPKLRGILSKAKNIVVLTGAGISAESGIPTFRGAGGFWRTYQSQDLATVGAFKRSPSLVWEFYHYRRELVFTKTPNKAHYAIAEAEANLAKAGRKLTIITQNIDGLHQAAGSKNVIELHGSLYKTQCIKCKDICINKESPICEALRGKGAPDTEAVGCEIPVEELPRCKKTECGGLLRPYIVWFGENLHNEDINSAEEAMSECDACLVIGTSSVVYPAAMYAPMLAERNVPVAEFNLEPTRATHLFIWTHSTEFAKKAGEYGSEVSGVLTNCKVVDLLNKRYRRPPTERFDPFLCTRPISVVDHSAEVNGLGFIGSGGGENLFHFEGPSSETVPEALRGICDN